MPHTPHGLIVKSTPHVLQLELGFNELVAETLIGCFKQHSIICSTRSGHIQAVVDVFEEGDLLIVREPLIL